MLTALRARSLWPRIVLGSDYPFPLGEHHPGQLIETTAGLSDEQRERMLWKNALEFLGRSEADFLKVQERAADDRQSPPPPAQ